MPARASIEPLEWENRFFGVNSAILRFGDDAPLTVQALAGWSRCRRKSRRMMPRAWMRCRH
jgi:dTDP-4-amino-4,6-dideoxy-D-galactose acyltransferase